MMKPTDQQRFRANLQGELVLAVFLTLERKELIHNEIHRFVSKSLCFSSAEL